MPQRITPSGELIKTGGTKSFNQIQTENAAALKAKLVPSVSCGVEAIPSVSSDPKAKLKPVLLEKIDV